MSASKYTDRELSWLEFNRRVLELAEDREIPLLERVRYLAIFGSNLDEFYMVRVATLKELIAGGVSLRNSAGFTPEQLLIEIVKKQSHSLSVTQISFMKRSRLVLIDLASISLAGMT